MITLEPLDDDVLEKLLVAEDPDVFNPDSEINVEFSLLARIEEAHRAQCGLTQSEFELLVAGDKPAAIGSVKERAGLGMREAKEHVETFGADYFGVRNCK